MLKKKNLEIGMLIIAFILCVVCSATAQKSTFEDNTLFNLKDKAESLKENRVMRLTILEEKYENGSKTPTDSVKYISEIIPPSLRRFITERKMKNGAVDREEFLNIGTDRYIKKNNGQWEVFKSSGGGGGVGRGNGNGEGDKDSPKIENTTEKKMKQGIIVNKQKADYYEITNIFKFTYPSGRIEVSRQTKGYWFDAEGKYLRTIEEERSTDFYSRHVTDYEYDPKITINAPLIGK